MKRLEFDGSEGAGENYDIIMDGLLNSPRGFEAPKETRQIGKVFDALEAIGTPVKRKVGVNRDGSAVEDDAFDLQRGGGIVDLEDAPYALALDSLKQVKWKAATARRATKAMDFFEAAVDPEEEEKKAKEKKEKEKDASSKA